MFLLARYSYRNLWVRRLTTALTAGGMGLVIFVFAAVLMLAAGFQKTLVTTGSPDNAVFVRRSSEAEVQSLVSREEAAIVESMPEIGLGRDGTKLAAREAVILINLSRRDTGNLAHVTVRGINPALSMQLRPRVRISAGREPRSGTSEILAGRSIMQRFAVGGLGQTMSFGSRTWTVVGILDAGGTGFDSEIWADVEVMMTTFRRSAYSSVIGRLREPSAFPALRKRAMSDPRLTLETWRETDYYASQSELMARFIRILGLTLTLIFSLGAVIGSMVTMYSAVANRVSEIGTLRALGFRRATILTAFLLESVFLSLVGGGLGLAAASFMNRISVSTMNWQTFSELSFRFALDSSIVVNALAFAVVMGLVGGILPALRAARMNIVTALRLQ